MRQNIFFAKAALLILVFLSGPVLAEDAQGPKYAPVTTLQVKVSPKDVCVDTCAAAAAAERAKLGAPPTDNFFYRPSASQTEASRTFFAKGLAKQLGISEAAAKNTVLERDETISAWKDTDPKGNFDPNDAADVFAKNWIFSWVFGSGVNPDKITEEYQAAVKAQTHRIFASDPVFSKLSESQRQALAENTMLGQVNFLMMLFNSAKDEKELGRTMNTIKSHFEQQYGIDLSTLALLPEHGFVQEVK